MSQAATSQEATGFSLVLGGPLFRVLRRARLSGDALEWLHRRMVLLFCAAWVPLLLLSAFEGHALGDALEIPFLHDIEAHVRFLVALPLLLVAERQVHRRLEPIVRKFLELGIVSPEDRPRFQGLIDSTMRARNSVTAEVTLLVFVYTVGLWVWWNQVALGSASWYGTPDGTSIQLTSAGYWYFFVSLPIFQFLLLRWYLRYVLWFSFLWRVSRLDLRLVPLHPDRMAGFGFLGESSTAFAAIFVAEGTMLSGLIANRTFHAGQDLLSFKPEIFGLLVFLVVAALGPLTVFAGHLSRAKSRILEDFDALAHRYAVTFEQKWGRGGKSREGELLGNADIQSFADLGNSYAVAQEIRRVPFVLHDVTPLVLATCVPLLPLLLTVWSPREVITYLIQALF